MEVTMVCFSLVLKLHYKQSCFSNHMEKLETVISFLLFKSTSHVLYVVMDFS